MPSDAESADEFWKSIIALRPSQIRYLTGFDSLVYCTSNCNFSFSVTSSVHCNAFTKFSTDSYSHIVITLLSCFTNHYSKYIKIWFYWRVRLSIYLHHVTVILLFLHLSSFLSLIHQRRVHSYTRINMKKKIACNFRSKNICRKQILKIQAFSLSIVLIILYRAQIFRLK